MADENVKSASTDSTADKVQAPGIDPSEFNRVKSDMHRFKEEARALKEQIEKTTQDKLKADQEWKTLAEVKEREAEDWKTKLQRTQDAYLNEKKYSAVKDAATALGLRKEALVDLDLVDLSDVQVETTSTGKINVLGADKFSERLKAIRPHWFSEKGAPNVNTSTVRVAGDAEPVTTKMILDAEKEAKKTGDYSRVSELMKQFKQRKA